MPSITARIPNIDWSKGFKRHWNGGSPSTTHAFNALSFLFPEAERYFIQVAGEVSRQVDTTKNLALAEAVKGFIAQEAVHSHQHTQYNSVLEAQGYKNVVSKFVACLQAQSYKHFSPLTRLAVVCAYEHYTAILGNFLLRNMKVLSSAQAEMALVWGWHSAEETDHKAVCFDLYEAAGGGWLRRVLAFFLVTMNFNMMFVRLYLSLLNQDRAFHLSALPRTMRETFGFFFGIPGIGWHLLRYGFAYLSPRFHPWQQENREELDLWLEANRNRLRVI